MTEVVYFVQAIESGRVKIGYTADAHNRIRQLQTASHEPLVVLATVVGGRDVERSIHAEFAHSRLQGEWFATSPELLSRIDALIVERGTVVAKRNQRLNTIAAQNDQYTAAARKWLGYLCRRERTRSKCASLAAFRIIGNRLGMGAGTIESISRGRNGPISGVDYDKFRLAAIAEYEDELSELNAMLARVGENPQAQTHLEAARALLNGGPK